MSARDATESIRQLLASLENISPTLEGREEDLQFLRDMLQSNEFHSLLTIHKQVNDATVDQAPTQSLNALILANTVSYDCELESGSCVEAEELFDLLTSPHIEAVISVHDKIANKEYPLQSVMATGEPASSNMSIDEESIRIVRIEKGTDPMGATVKTNQDGNIVISRVLVGGAADKCGMLAAGDIIHQINGKEVKGYSIDDIANLMKRLVGSVVFKITSSESSEHGIRRKRAEPPLFMRALFSYDPTTDYHHPCQEAGLKFENGTILLVVNQNDPDWWQAVKEGEQRIRAGIIPSKTFRERLETYDRYGKEPARRSSKAKVTRYTSSYQNKEGFGREIITYEQVVKINPQIERPRPIMLIAPRGQPFDLESIKKKLLQHSSVMFGVPIAHTSRPQFLHEVNSIDFFFVGRQQMERDIQNHRFIEHAFYDGHYYGTSINSVRQIVNSGKTCLLFVIPQSIKFVRTPELKPFLIYLKPPSADYMKQHWVAQRVIKESSIADTLRQATHLEQSFSHYVDHTILFKDNDSAQQEVVTLANRLRQDQQWVPASWADYLAQE